MKRLNKTERDSLVSRIYEIAGAREKKPCFDGMGKEKPGIEDYLRKAVIDGSAKFKPATQILAEAKRRVIKEGNYNEVRLPLNELFETPPEYIRAMDSYRRAEFTVQEYERQVNQCRDRLVDEVICGIHDENPNAALEKMRSCNPDTVQIFKSWPPAVEPAKKRAAKRKV